MESCGVNKGTAVEVTAPIAVPTTMNSGVSIASSTFLLKYSGNPPLRPFQKSSKNGLKVKKRCGPCPQ